MLALAFLAMSLLSIPAFYSNFSGNGILNTQNSINYLSKFSLANQPNLNLLVPAYNSTSAEISSIQAKN